jgi:hypothetical protein
MSMGDGVAERACERSAGVLIRRRRRRALCLLCCVLPISAALPTDVHGGLGRLEHYPPLVGELPRLRHSGYGWDAGISQTSSCDRALYSIMRTYFQSSHRLPAEPRPITLRQLSEIPTNAAPVALYITGTADPALDSFERAALRRYVLYSGVLLSSCPTDAWQQAFRDLVRDILPDSAMEEIPFDAPDFGRVYATNNRVSDAVAGNQDRLLGVKQGGRWMVFLYTGCLHTAWADGGQDVAKRQLATGTALTLAVVTYALVTSPQAEGRKMAAEQRREEEERALATRRKEEARKRLKGTLEGALDCTSTEMSGVLGRPHSPHD